MSDDKTQDVTWEQNAGIGLLRLNRPQSLNSWTTDVALHIGGLLDDAEQNDTTRAVVLTGAGRAFSSGKDLSSGGDDVALRKELLAYHDLIRRVRRFPKPLVAAVNGPTAGIACSLVLSCDVAVAADSAFFLYPFVDIGLLPDGGSTMLLPAAVGRARAMQMVLLGERIKAPQLLEWGLVNAVVPLDELPTAGADLARTLAGKPPAAYAAAKKALNRATFGGLDDQLDYEARIQGELAALPDFHERVAAFRRG